MAYFPFLIDIKRKLCVIAGGGAVAYRKAEIMLGFGAKVKVVAPDISDSMKLLVENGKEIMIQQRNFQINDLRNADFVIAATDDERVNSYISQKCRERDILVNVVDVKEECSFIFPAVIKKDDLLISISSGGNSPAAAAFLKDKIEDRIPDYYGKVVTMLGRYRRDIKETVLDAQDRKELYYELLEYAAEHNGELAECCIKAMIGKYAANRRSEDVIWKE